jgi:Cu(I)/Ag(I) efflux system membrane fusion protein
MRFIETVALALLAACASRKTEAVRAGDFQVRLQLDPDPPRAGDNALEVMVEDAQGRPVDGAQLSLTGSMPAMGAMPEMKSGGEVKALGGGKYRVDYPLAMPGDWSVVLGIHAQQGHGEVRFKVSPPRKGYVLERSAGAPREAAPQAIELGAERQQLIGVVYAPVERRPLSLSLRAAGRVEVDETQLHDVTLKYDAYVEKLLVDQTGQQVAAGQPLLVLYSPELLASERDWLFAQGNEQLARAAEERLRLWGLSDQQLAELRKRGKAEPRITIRSPAAGTVLEKNAVAGAKAMAGMPLYRIGNLGRVWVQAELFESDAPHLRTGLSATMTLPWASGDSWNGTVQFVSPTVDEKTRSLRARLVFPNARLELKPGMFVDVRIEVPLGTRLAVPDSALLASGEHRYAFVQRGEGLLEAREVHIGARAGDFDEVLSGLSEGEQVATQATFLLSSEAQLRGALPRWSAP